MAAPMDRLEELVAAFARSSFSGLEVSEGGTRVTLRRATQSRAAAAPPSQAVAAPAVGQSERNARTAGPASQPALTRRQPGESASEPPAIFEDRRVLLSPRVGRFYELRNAQGKALIVAGTRLSKGQTYGTVESIHLQYELRAEREGVVERMLAGSGEAVEFGQPLVLLEA